MLSLNTDHLNLHDQLMVSLAIADWEKAESIQPDHPLFSAPVLDLVIDSCGGACPTQAEGTITGVPFYFRARHGSWRLGLGAEPIGEPEIELSGSDDTAGFMEDDEVRVYLERGAKLLNFLRKRVREHRTETT